MESYGRVVWSPLMQAEAERAAQRPAPSIEESKGNRPVHPAGFGHTKENQSVIDLRNRWLETKIQTSGLPRGRQNGVAIKT